jgi:aspartyl-tRNA(Asn)/glutamyl-tRNA(Gln) amidotransferase subunit A
MQTLPTIAAARAQLSAGTLSPVELTSAVLAAIAANGPAIGAYTHVDAEDALAQAEKADTSLPLGGIPIAVKDNLNVAGQPCSCSSKMLEGTYTAPYDATAIARLRAAGAVLVGRTNMDEFAMGSSTENSALQVTRNPWDTSRIPGGSSGGSAAAVAAHMALAALGSDTGGSIRQPAALCGCVGLKPTYGRVSRYGLVAFASSLDQIGPLTRTAEDAALLLQALAGHDPLDSTSLDQPVPDYSQALAHAADLKGLKVGIPAEFFPDSLDPALRSTVEAAIGQLVELGATPVPISLPTTGYALDTYYIIATAEASSNLARFDAVRYGHRAADPAGLFDLYARSRAEGFGPEVKRRILLGTYVLSSGYYDAYYLRAQKVRTLIRQDLQRALSQVDLIASPTSPTPAFPIGDRSSDPLQMYLADIFTLSANLAGLPAISIPCGFLPSPGGQLPVGLQLIAPPLAEATLLSTAHLYQSQTSWHQVPPPI